MSSRSVSRALAIAACLATVSSVSTACGLTPSADLRGVRWLDVAGRDLNCTHKTALVGPAHLYDITGDGRADAFVTMRCVMDGPPRPEPGQLEVFAGDSDPANPVRLATLVHKDEHIVLDNCVWFTGQRVIIRGPGVVRVAVWQAKERQLLPDPAIALSPQAVPACA